MNSKKKIIALVYTVANTKIAIFLNNFNGHLFFLDPLWALESAFQNRGRLHCKYADEIPSDFVDEGSKYKAETETDKKMKL